MPFECRICQTKYPDERDLASHSRWHSVIEPFACQTDFASGSSRPNFFRVHPGLEEYLCSECQITYLQKIPSEPPPGCTFTKDFPCWICRKNFPKQRLPPIRLTEYRTVFCYICGRKYSTERELKRHLWYHTVEKPYVCGVCLKAFSHKRYLKSHFQYHTRSQQLTVHNTISHTGEKPSACKVCEKRFALRQGQ